MKRIVIFCAVILFSLTAFGQTDLPNLSKMKTIRANSDMADIRDGDILYKKAWKIAPAEKPDILSTQSKSLTFITDLDSITFNIERNKTYDFVVLLGKDSAWTQIKSTPSYLEALQQAGSYQKSDTVGLPSFFYETPENARMKNVRNYFNLDSIAGDGDEISKLLNIMYWVHNNIRHDGSNFALSEFSSIDLYHYHKATGKGINCRHLAIALNEMYLSMGWKSRYVTCLPKNENDGDCHVINSVWVDSLQKWIWLDPTFAAYVKDENGTLLSINEVRERLIDGRPLVLNEDANWNNQDKRTKEWYLINYMAKNLYWIQVPVNSMFNPESRYRNNVNKYVSLLPIGYTRSNMESMGTITHDHDYFWQKPFSGQNGQLIEEPKVDKRVELMSINV